VFTDPADPALSRASSNFDVRHSFSLSYVYALPFSSSRCIAHTVGWLAGIRYHYGIVRIALHGNNGTTYSDNAGVANGVGVLSYPDVVGDPTAVTQLSKLLCRGRCLRSPEVQPSGIALPVGLTFVRRAQISLRLPGRFNNDFGLFKRFEFRERYAFEFRWENFNVFNHTQLDQVNGNGLIWRRRRQTWACPV